MKRIFSRPLLQTLTQHGRRRSPLAARRSPLAFHSLSSSLVLFESIDFKQRRRNENGDGEPKMKKRRRIIDFLLSPADVAFLLRMESFMLRSVLGPWGLLNGLKTLYCFFFLHRQLHHGPTLNQGSCCTWWRLIVGLSLWWTW
ncbi:hypothetical protein P8452_70184 [Trifolium repens]|nr:hypothetical protein P8452_70184 [Trifolium repens]